MKIIFTKKKRRSYHWFLVLISLFQVYSTGVLAADYPVRNIYLVQNSGWMEPFYVDVNSQFKPLVAAVIEKTSHDKEAVVLAAFNQAVGVNLSPALAYTGNDRTAMVNALQNIALAHKPGGIAYADTDFQEAIISSITQYSPGTPCILWIFTNNKNSPQNSPETIAKNKEFYNWLQKEEKIRRIVAYPYPMAVKGKRYQANGVMVYALAYGEEANTALENLIAANLPFWEKPARLKPLNADAVTFTPTSIVGGGGVRATLGTDQKTLELHFDSSNKPEVAVINGEFRNDFFPYDISSAIVSFTVNFQGENHGIQSAIEPQQIADLPAGKSSQQIEVKIAIPPLPSIWANPEIIFKSGYQVPANMEFVLSNQDLKISNDFTSKMSKLFPGDLLPEIFIPGESAKQSVTSRPLLVKVVYPIWPLILLVLTILSLLIGSILLINLFAGAKQYTVTVDGVQKKYVIKVFGESTLYSNSNQGERIGSLKRGLGKPVPKLDKGRSEKVFVL